MKAERHPFEAARVGALHGYDILDTPREPDYDDVVDIVRRICGTAVAVINFIDTDRQWFKAEVGLGTRETPLETSICAHIILGDDFVEIADTANDPRLRDNPLCLGDGAFRFYAGAVLRTADDLPIGTVCVLDYAPRRLDDLQRDTLRLLTKQVMRQLDLRALVAREAVRRREIDHRVKNSLHSVAAFARLKRRGVGREIDTTLAAVEQQVASVATLHDLISVVDDDRIAMDDYLTRLTALLGDIAPDAIAVAGRFDPFTADATLASALGVIVNELVANAVKHSFAGDGGGTVRLTGEAPGDGTYRLTCTDDGPGPLAVATGRRGLGVAIMTSAIRQLHGDIASGSVAGGYRSVVSFPLPEHSVAGTTFRDGVA